jgi:hypothetical protein
MTQPFSRRGQLAAKLAFLAACVLVVALGAWAVSLNRTWQDIGEPLPQPIAFSHKHHAGDDGIDCRYCHTSVETSAYAGLPSTHICLSCHSQLYVDAVPLQPLHESAATGKPIEWRRVHTLPDFVYFNHAVHVNKGVACLECHGRVDQMPLTWRAERLNMQWCLGCHRNPAPHLRPRSQVFSMDRSMLTGAEADAVARLMRLERERRRTDCSTCHR